VAIGDSVYQSLKLIDVTHKCIEYPKSYDEIGTTVNRGEKNKLEFYEKTCEFPSGVTSVLFSIDSYGRWGDMFTKFLKQEVSSATCGRTD